MRKRWAMAVLVSLLLGVLLNIAVAWGLAAFISVRPPAQQIAAPQPMRWPRTVPTDWPSPNEVHIGRWWCCTTIHAGGYTRIPGESEPDPVSRAPYQNAYTLMISQWGWPMRSLEIQWSHSQPMLVSIWLFKRPTEAALRTGMPISTSITRSPERTHLPLMPVWPGFLINSLVYAALVGGAMFAPGAARRARRRRRGQCIACGYDLAGLTKCPECGRNRSD